MPGWPGHSLCAIVLFPMRRGKPRRLQPRLNFRCYGAGERRRQVLIVAEHRYPGGGARGASSLRANKIVQIQHVHVAEAGRRQCEIARNAVACRAVLGFLAQAAAVAQSVSKAIRLPQAAWPVETESRRSRYQDNLLCSRNQLFQSAQRPIDPV